MTPPILSVTKLRTSFHNNNMWTPVIRDISFDVAPKSTVAIVGESGSGKSMTALSIMRLLPEGNSRVKGNVSLAAGRCSISARRRCEKFAATRSP